VLLKVEEPVPPGRSAVPVRHDAGCSPLVVGLNQGLQQHPKAPAWWSCSTMSSPSHGTWPSPLVHCLALLRKVRIHHPHCSPGSLVGLTLRWQLLTFEPRSGDVCSPAAASLSRPDLRSRSALSDRHKSIPKAKVGCTHRPSIGLGAHVEVNSVFPGDGVQDPVSHAETE